MNKKIFALALGTVLLAMGFAAEAQQQAKVAKIGWLAVRPASAAFAIESFQREFVNSAMLMGRTSFRVSIRRGEARPTPCPGR